MCPVLNNTRDGQGRHTITKSKVNYYPNRFEVPKLAAGGDDLRRHGATNKPGENFIEMAKVVEEQGYVDYPETLPAPTFKTHTKGPKFAEYRSQSCLFARFISIADATPLSDQVELFSNSLSGYEKEHVIEAFSFELDHCDEPIVYERMVLD